MLRLVARLTLALATFALSGPAVAPAVKAGPIVYVTTDEAHLGTVDLGSGQYTDIGVTKAGNQPVTFRGITFVGGTLFGAGSPGTGGGLYTIDPANGKSTLVGNFNASAIVGLASNSQGRLYAVSAGNLVDGKLYAVNSGTGALTPIGTGLMLPNGYLASRGGLAFGAQDNLFLTSYDVSGRLGERLYRVDPANGSGTAVGGADPDIPALRGLVFAGDTLYAFRTNDDNTIETVNTTNGMLTAQRAVTGLGGRDYIVAATAAAPEPASITLLAVGALGLLGYAWRRRRRTGGERGTPGGAGG
jgi:hypothetical protein